LREPALDAQPPTIDAALARRLVGVKFPHWAELPVVPVAGGGWDNRTFRLGPDMAVRLPSAARYASQVEKEHHWLPVLRPLLPLPVPVPLAIGEPGLGYPWRWSIYRWLPGEAATLAPIADLSKFAMSLAEFLTALQRIDTSDGPAAGRHNFWRGGPLATYEAETRAAIAKLAGRIDVEAVTEVWDAGVATKYHGAPVWVHGDVAAGNLLVEAGRLSAVIDFGCLGVGDPACDLAVAWTLFEGESRAAFRAGLALDSGTWARGRGWTLWKALIVLAALPGANPAGAGGALGVIEAVVADHARA
jgi:aminoglycoside phosphotransferase (APT) family kinase protein